MARARRACPQAMARFDAFEAALAQVQEALEYVDLNTGELRGGEDVQKLMAQAAQVIACIDAPGCQKLAGYRAPGLSLSAAALNTQLQALASAYARLQLLLDSRADKLLDMVKGLLDKRDWASSAIEGFNAALRPYLYVHKSVTQPTFRIASHRVRNKVLHKEAPVAPPPVGAGH
jgi:hypothetical protein